MKPKDENPDGISIDEAAKMIEVTIIPRGDGTATGIVSVSDLFAVMLVSAGSAIPRARRTQIIGQSLNIARSQDIEAFRSLRKTFTDSEDDYCALVCLLVTEIMDRGVSDIRPALSILEHFHVGFDYAPAPNNN